MRSWPSLDDPNVALVDARTPEEYAAGHIPGAVNVNFPRNAEPDEPKYWKPAAELLALYADHGVTADKQVIPYCATGVRSAVTYFTLRLLGYDDVALYTGSWDEVGRPRGHPEGDGRRAAVGLPLVMRVTSASVHGSGLPRIGWARTSIHRLITRNPGEGWLNENAVSPAARDSNPDAHPDKPAKDWLGRGGGPSTDQPDSV